mgnify:CR=1 FL=1
MGLAISIAWNAFRASTAAEILNEVKDLGFSEIELSFNLTSRCVDDFQKLVQEGSIRITSVHNFCPIPDGLSKDEALPDVYSMASCDETIRQRSVEYTKKSIETAQRVGARAVVLHCGRVEIPDRTRELINLYIRGKKDSEEYQSTQSKIIGDRQHAKKPFFENTLRSLEELERFARERAIILGVETRYYYREIPSFEEIGIILKEFKNSSIFYWHDVGHAQLMENLGFTKHKDYLSEYATAMAGIHLHDISGYHDHKAPLRGNFDFSIITPYLRKETIKVIEAHFPASEKEIIKGKRFLEKIFHGKI